MRVADPTEENKAERDQYRTAPYGKEDDEEEEDEMEAEGTSQGGGTTERRNDAESQ